MLVQTALTQYLVPLHLLAVVMDQVRHQVLQLVVLVALVGVAFLLVLAALHLLLGKEI